MKVIIVRSDQFLKALGEPADQKIISLINQLSSLEKKHVIVIIQPEKHNKGLADKLEELKLDNCCTLLNEPRGFAAVRQHFFYQQSLTQHLNLNYGKQEIECIEVCPGKSFRETLQAILKEKVPALLLEDINDVTPRYPDIEQLSYSPHSGFALEVESGEKKPTFSF